jgi:hypothetical protein
MLECVTHPDVKASEAQDSRVQCRKGVLHGLPFGTHTFIMIYWVCLVKV